MKKSKISLIIRKYNSISAPAKASMWFALCTILQRGISLITTPIFTRIMSTSEYGLYSVYQSWYTIISTVATLHLAAGVYNNGLLKYENDRKRFTSSMLGLSTCATFVLFIIYILGMRYWNQVIGLSTPIMLSMFVELFFVPAYSFWAAEQRFDFKYKALIFVTLFISTASPVLGIVSVLNSVHKAEARILSYVLIQVIVGLFIYIIIFLRGKNLFVFKYWKYALVFNLPLIPHYLSRNILNQSDRIMIQNMVGASEAGIYSIAYTVSMMMSIITTAINSSYTPYTYKSIKRNKLEALRKNTSVLLIASCVICFGVIAFGPEVIRIIAAPEYYEARWIVPTVASASFFIFATGFYGNVLFYYEKTKFIMIASVAAAILNILLNYLAIPLFGYIAAAYTTLICQISMMVTYYIFYRIQIYKEGVERIYNDKLLVLTSLVIIIFSIGITFVYDYIVVRYTVIVLILGLIILKRNKLSSFWKEIKEG